MADPEVWAYLGVYGVFDPSELTVLLGVAGQERRSSDRGRGGSYPPHDSWSFETSRERTVEWSHHVDRVLSIVRPVRSAFVQYCESKGLDRQLGMVASMSGPTPIGSLDALIVQEIAALGCAISIDLFVDDADDIE